MPSQIPALFSQRSPRLNTVPLPAERALPVLLVFSHLRWNFVFQRPQHLMSRLARQWRVIFVEEPVHAEGTAHLVQTAAMPGVTVLVPHSPVAASGFHDEQISMIETLLARHLASQGIDDVVAWLYTPMALPLLQALPVRCVIYDCMDELSAFRNAPLQLRQRERALLSLADLVFTGGPSLHESKREFNPQVICMPSSVDARHFEPALLVADSPSAGRARALQDALAKPRLGYFGVIDERIDLELLRHLADARPEWQIVMVGPVVKIDPATLPQRPNLHWLGMQAYDDLPYLLAGWDLCLMPFAINDATRYISPTKTLEYMAGERPVVSTAVRDVVMMYGDVVRVADDKVDFVRACEETLAEAPVARSRTMIKMLNAVAAQSWDGCAESADRLMKDTLAAKDQTRALMVAASEPGMPAATRER